jgi:integrase
MANLGKKSGIYHIRFRFKGKEFKKSLKVRDRSAAEAAKNLVELTIHRLLIGQIEVPEAVDVGDFILSGGTLLEPTSSLKEVLRPPLTELVDVYQVGQENLLSKSYLDSQALHLRHLMRHLGDRAGASCSEITYRDLDGFLKARLAIRHPNTAERERITLLQFFKWAAANGYVSTSPAATLAPIKGESDRPPFRTTAEIKRILARGGLSEADKSSMWECLFLSPAEIAELLATVRANAADENSFFLHAIPAYTGMRRGEVLRLRWLDVELDEGFLTARSRKQSRRKTETVRRIDLHPELKNELTALRHRRSKGQFVICDPRTLEPLSLDQANRGFWQPMNGTTWCLDRKRRHYKIGFHTYRHSFASNLAALGVDQRVIDEWMGHQTEAMRKRYRHLYPRTRQSAIESFSLLDGTARSLE